MPNEPSKTVWTPAVAIAAWLLPGAGYWLLGQRVRAIVVGVTIIVLFTTGLLIGGVRVVEVPGYGDHGQRLIVSEEAREVNNQRVMVEQVTEPNAAVPSDAQPVGWVMHVHPLSEIRNKPWSIAQILAGPLDIIASWGSVRASLPGPDGLAVGARSHARTNELGLLYTAVAGMLNLLAIIDSSYRAARAAEAQ